MCKMALFLNVCCSVFILVNYYVNANDNDGKFDIKIVEGLPKKKNTYSHSSTPVLPTPSRKPHTISPSTPSDFLHLDGKCFSENIGRYEYKVCPFRNITQLDKQTTWNPFYGILGLWGNWKDEDIENSEDAYKAQVYNDGTPCGGNIKRKVQVNLVCSERYTISNVEEPHTCDYTLTFALPESCNLNTSTTSAINETIIVVSNDSEENNIENDENGDDNNNIDASTGNNIRINNIENDENGDDNNNIDASNGNNNKDDKNNNNGNENEKQDNNNNDSEEVDIIGFESDVGIMYELTPQSNVENIQTPWSNFKEAQIVQIDGDGDCGYESVSYALKDLYKMKNKDIPTGSELRQLVGLNPLKPPNLNKATFEKARKRSKNNEWAENDELAILAYLYNTCIVVYQSGVSATFDRWSIIMPDVNECEKDQTIYLYNTKRLHFDVLVNLKPV